MSLSSHRASLPPPTPNTRDDSTLGLVTGTIYFAGTLYWITGVMARYGDMAFWVAVYGPTITRERDYLRELYGAAYSAYEANVPAFLPRLSAWRGPVGADRSGGFSLPLYLRHNEWQAGLGFLFVLAWLRFSPWR